jgi:hypothetical protein
VGKEGADDVGVARLYASQSAQACAAYEVEEEGLDAVVAMVGDADVVGVDVAAELLEIGVAQVACCHLDADMMQVGIGMRVEVDEVEGYVEATA